MSDLTKANWSQWGTCRAYAGENWAASRARRKGYTKQLDLAKSDVMAVARRWAEVVGEAWGFETPTVRWKVRGNGGSYAQPDGNLIAISNQWYPLDVIAHELAHLVAHHIWQDHSHGLRFCAANVEVSGRILDGGYGKILETGYGRVGFDTDGPGWWAALLDLQ